MHAQVFCIYSAYDVRMHVRTQAVPALSLLVKVHATAFLVLSISVPHIWPLAFSILLCLQPAVGEAVSFCPKPGGFRAGDEDRLCESNPEPAEASSEEKVEAKHRAASASWRLNQEYGRGFLRRAVDWTRWKKTLVPDLNASGAELRSMGGLAAKSSTEAKP